MRLQPKKWWYIAPAYLTIWTVVFSFWNLLDGSGMMEAFGIDTGEVNEFIMLNSASRYVAIGVGMIAGIWVFKTYHSILTILLVRLSMDLLDLGSGLQSGIIQDATGVIQSLLMFILPNLFAIYTIQRFRENRFDDSQENKE